VTDVVDELRRLLDQRDLTGAASLALETYGAEVYGFLVNELHGDAADVFSAVSERFWRGLGAFEGRCSVRTWLYVLARNAASEWRKSPRNRRDLHTGISELDAIVTRVRTHTEPWRRSEVKDQIRALRDALPDEDRMLLILRVDRELEWDDVARVMLDVEAREAAIARESARLRKRFQLIKDELRDRARAAGILDGD